MSRYKTEKTPDGKILYFPEGALLNQMEVAVVESERRKSDYLKEPYIVYLVETRPVENAIGFDPGCALWRRYSEFELLRNYLMAIYPYLVMPPIPEKRINVAKFQLATDKFDPDFIERRRQGLECFLLRLASHAVFSQDALFRGFLSQDVGWKESVAASGWKQNTDNRFKSIGAAIAVKKPDQRFERIRSYCDSLSANIAALLKVQQRISSRTLSAAKQHSEYGKVFAEWSFLEGEVSDLLQQAGHYMDRLASQTQATLNGETVAYIDQLKEYLFFTDSLRAIVRKQNSRQWNLEKAEENLSAKSRQKSLLMRDIQLLESGEDLAPPTGLKSVQNMIFGADSLEEKQLKLLTLEEEVKAAESSAGIAEQDANIFIEKSLQDYERFRKQKIRDVDEIMENYIKTQIKVNKVGLQEWEAMKEYFLEM